MSKNISDDNDGYIDDTVTRKIKIGHDEETKCIPLICSWCNKIYRISQWKIRKDVKTNVSHGMCPACIAARFGKENDTKPKNS